MSRLAGTANVFCWAVRLGSAFGQCVWAVRLGSWAVRLGSAFGQCI